MGSVRDTCGCPDGVCHTFGATSYCRTFHKPARGTTPALEEEELLPAEELERQFQAGLNLLDDIDAQMGMADELARQQMLTETQRPREGPHLCFASSVVDERRNQKTSLLNVCRRIHWNVLAVGYRIPERPVL